MTIENDEIDLRPYILALVRRWWQILLIGVIAAGLAGGVTLLQARSYAATAAILINRNRISLDLAQQFPTTSEPLDLRSRVDATETIILSDSVLQETIQKLGDRLPAADRETSELKTRGKLETNGDLLMLTVSAASPELASEIANTWASAAVSAVNRAYNGEQPISKVEEQLQTTRKDYETAQNQLVDFLRKSQVHLLENQVKENANLYKGLTQERSNRIDYYLAQKKALGEVILQGQALKAQLAAQPNSAAASMGDAIAVLRARANVFQIASTATLTDTMKNMDIQLTIPATITVATRAGYGQDLDQIISQATAELEKTNQSLQALVADIKENPNPEVASQVAAQLSSSEALLEQEKARQKDLTSRRDLAWQAYQAVLQKATELQNSTPTNQEVNLASLAVPSQSPAPRGAVRNALIAGVFGLLVGTLAVVLLEWWRLANMGSYMKAAEPERAAK